VERFGGNAGLKRLVARARADVARMRRAADGGPGARTVLTLAQAAGCNVASHRTTGPTETRSMCRNIRTLYHFDPPVTDAEIEAAARQFVRKVSGFGKPSAVNRGAFEHAIAQVSETVRVLLDSLVTHAPPRSREVEAAKAKARSARRAAGLRPGTAARDA
jgi:hypothetical protein